ncbi:MAG: hypothetical protein AAF705_06480, partial [Bacteroidota bacterium]
DEEMKTKFENYKAKGIDGLMYNGGQDPATYARVGAIAKAAGLEFHAWIPTMVQAKTPEIDSSWYALNRNGESALTKPAYVPYYTFLSPCHPGTYEFLKNMYTKIAAVPEIDAVHLDYIRFPDVILARGLWDKYGLVMDKEYPEYDYDYSELCTGAFKEQTGIDILEVEDPSQVEEWKQFRYDLITSIVNRLAEEVHAEGKKINAAVFPGPNSIAKKIVRQEWDKWDLDAVYPMLYNDFYLEKPEWVGDMAKEGVAAIENRIPLYAGLFICPKPDKKGSEKDPENHGLLPEEIETAVRAAMENGAAGVCLFTPERMIDAHWEAFDKAIHQKYTVK